MKPQIFAPLTLRDRLTLAAGFAVIAAVVVAWVVMAGVRT